MRACRPALPRRVFARAALAGRTPEQTPVLHERLADRRPATQARPVRTVIHVPARGLLVPLDRRIGGLLGIHRVQATGGQAAVHQVTDEDPELTQALDRNIRALTVRRDTRKEESISAVDVANTRDDRLIHDDLANRALLRMSHLGETLHGLGVRARPGIQGIRAQLRLRLDAFLIRDEIAAVRSDQVGNRMVVIHA